MRLIGHHSTSKDTGRGGAAENAHGRMRPADVGWTCRMYGHLMGGIRTGKVTMHGVWPCGLRRRERISECRSTDDHAESPCGEKE